MIFAIPILYYITSYSKCIIFFTGGSNLMPLSLYSDFLNPLKNIYPIYKFSLDNDISDKLNILYKKYDNIIFMGHSSGCTTAINNCNNNVKTLLLLDPVKTPNFINRDLNFLKNIIILNAEKSYKWSIIPPFIPFIPLFRLTENDLIINKNKIKIITIKNFGHSDLINNPWRDIMHYSRISLGNTNRDIITISNYHNLIKEYID